MSGPIVQAQEHGADVLPAVAGLDGRVPLKGDLSGYWSRRIDDEHRLVYRADDKEVKILKPRYHYSD
jgi:toxin YoeB